MNVVEREQQSIDERVAALEGEVQLLKDELTEWTTYAARLNKRLDRLVAALVTTSPEAAHLLDRA